MKKFGNFVIYFGKVPEYGWKMYGLGYKAVWFLGFSKAL